MAKFPDRLYIDKSDRKLYDDDTLNIEIFSGKTRKEQFLFAMAVGFKNKIKRSLDSREGFFLAKDMHSEDEALLDAVALHDKGYAEILSDREEVFKIAEEYAHAGIKLLSNEVTSGQPGSYIKKFEVELFTLLSSLDQE